MHTYKKILQISAIIQMTACLKKSIIVLDKLISERKLEAENSLPPICYYSQSKQQRNYTTGGIK